MVNINCSLGKNKKDSVTKIIDKLTEATDIIINNGQINRYNAEIIKLSIDAAIMKREKDIEIEEFIVNGLSKYSKTKDERLQATVGRMINGVVSEINEQKKAIENAKRIRESMISNLDTFVEKN